MIIHGWAHAVATCAECASLLAPGKSKLYLDWRSDKEKAALLIHIALHASSTAKSMLTSC